MGKVKKEEITEDVEVVDFEQEKAKRKEEFDKILQKIKKMSDAIELHSNVKEAVSKEEVDSNYLSYIENSIEDKLFNDAKFDKIKSKVLLEIVCPELANIENFDITKLEINDIGSHYEEQENYIDKICTYDSKFICLFGVNEVNQDKVIKYDKRKFSREDMIEAVKSKLQDGQKAHMDQYDEYYVVTDENGLKVFSERKIVSLVKVEETVFDKIKSKLSSFFHNNLFSRKNYLPNMELIYESNPNRLKEFKTSSKIDAKKRMKVLLNKEREVTRAIND